MTAIPAGDEKYSYKQFS